MHCKMSSSSFRALMFAAMTGMAAGSLVAQQEPPERPLSMGTTKGERVSRLVIQNAMIISGRGEPGTNRTMPPEGPADIVVENGVIRNIIPLDPVNMRSRGQRARATGERTIDAGGMYVIPGLIEMHAHLPGKTSPLGERGLEVLQGDAALGT